MMGDKRYITNNEIFFLTFVSEKLSSKSVELLQMISFHGFYTIKICYHIKFRLRKSTTLILLFH